MNPPSTMTATQAAAATKTLKEEKEMPTDTEDTTTTLKNAEIHRDNVREAKRIMNSELDWIQDCYIGHALALPSLVEMLDTFPNDPEKIKDGLRPYIFSMNSNEVTITVNFVNNVKDTMKMIHPKMRKLGWEVGEFNGQYATWRWRKDDQTTRFNFAFDEDSACKKVQVGTREVPIYELQCGGKTVETIEDPSNN